eukprot:1744254-Pleurochrysis_carterae.AAC.1
MEYEKSCGFGCSVSTRHRCRNDYGPDKELYTAPCRIAKESQALLREPPIEQRRVSLKRKGQANAVMLEAL